MKKKLLLFLLGILFCAAQAIAQSKTITGKVVADEDGYPLPGVSVKIKGTNTGTQTDVQGAYNIRAAVGQTLVFSFVGTTTQEIVVADAATINIKLRQDTKALKEVTVTTGFGVAQRQRDLTSSVQTVSGAAIAETQRENLVNALQGRIAGATVTSTSGVPGASASIVLRGITSIGGSNQPLFVVDGIRVNNDAMSQSALASNGDNRREDFTNRIADINPDDIENVTVLKGADAAAVYGSDAAGGAIVITTKKGKSGAGNITYNNNFSFSNEYRFPKIQTVYGPGTAGYADPTTRLAYGPAYATGTQTYNNLKNFLQTGHSELHDLAFAGGNEEASYRISGEYRHTSGVIPVVYNDKLSLRFAGQAKITPKLTSSATFNYFNINIWGKIPRL